MGCCAGPGRWLWSVHGVMRLEAIAALFLLAAGPAAGQGAALAKAETAAPGRTAADATISTRRDARAITQALPAPRGLITVLLFAIIMIVTMIQLKLTQREVEY